MPDIYELDPELSSDGYNEKVGLLYTAWGVDDSQADGHRTYEVARARRILRDLGISPAQVDEATVLARMLTDLTINI